jgi:uncharacterized delta-60 repeat protein
MVAKKSPSLIISKSFVNLVCIISIYLMFFSAFRTQAQDGFIDESFNHGFGPGLGQYVTFLALQTDGKILIGGDFTIFDAIPTRYLTRRNTDGSLDPSFYVGTALNSVVQCIKIQDDGKILVSDGVLKRLNIDGSIDNTFQSGGTVGVYAIDIDANGKIIIAGNSTGSNYTILERLNIDGSLDASFNAPIANDVNAYARAVCVQNDGKILLGGGSLGSFNNIWTSTYTNLMRFNQNGDIDATFNTGDGLNGEIYNQVYRIYEKNDGKILISGYIGGYGGQSKSGILQLFNNGDLDNSFNTGQGGDMVNEGVIDFKIQPDGKIIIAGGFTYVNNVPKRGIARLDVNGNLDQSFGLSDGTPGLSWGAFVSSVVLQSDNKVLIGGSFTMYDGIGRFCVARINNSSLTSSTQNLSPEIHLISPNPSTSFINITSSMDLKGERYNITDQIGKLVISGEFNYPPFDINLSSLSEGTYFLKFDNPLFPAQKILKK